MRLATTALAALLLTTSVVACGASPARDDPPPVSLRMRYDDGAGHVRVATLRCDGGAATRTGYLRGGARGLCAFARRKVGLLSREPADRVCIQRYFGPQTARVRGRIGELALDRRFHRHDGCGNADWRAAGALLPPPR